MLEKKRQEDGEFQGSLGYFRRPEHKQTGTKEHHKVKVKGVRGAECLPTKEQRVKSFKDPSRDKGRAEGSRERLPEEP